MRGTEADLGTRPPHPPGGGRLPLGLEEGPLILRVGFEHNSWSPDPAPRPNTQICADLQKHSHALHTRGRAAHGASPTEQGTLGNNGLERCRPGAHSEPLELGGHGLGEPRVKREESSRRKGWRRRPGLRRGGGAHGRRAGGGRDTEGVGWGLGPGRRSLSASALRQASAALRLLAPPVS